jgi:hypothetical protein
MSFEHDPKVVSHLMLCRDDITLKQLADTQLMCAIGLKPREVLEMIFDTLIESGSFVISEIEQSLTDRRLENEQSDVEQEEDVKQYANTLTLFSNLYNEYGLHDK